MRERPILFSGPMVRAILAVTKTVTRRVVRIPEIVRAEPGDLGSGECLADYTTIQQRDDGVWRAWMTEYPDEGSVTVACPYGAPGDRLWVRETWYDDLCPRTPEDLEVDEDGGVVGIDYRATHDCLAYEAGCPCNPEGDGKRSEWRPSIFMPRWASRITLQVVSVRVERLQDITEEDAKREGVEPHLMKQIGDYPEWMRPGMRQVGGHESAFHDLWEKLNGKRPGCSWSDNPWVWRVEFRRLERSEHTGGKS